MAGCLWGRSTPPAPEARHRQEAGSTNSLNQLRLRKQEAEHQSDKVQMMLGSAACLLELLHFCGSVSQRNMQ